MDIARPNELKGQLEIMFEYNRYLEISMSSQQEKFREQLSQTKTETEILRKELESTKEYYQTKNQDIRLKTYVEENLRSQEILLLSQKLEKSYETVDRLKKRILKYRCLNRKHKEKKFTKKDLEESKLVLPSRPYSFIHFEHENPGLPKQNRIECSPTQHSDNTIEQVKFPSSTNHTVSIKIHPDTNSTTNIIETSSNSLNFRAPLQPVITEHKLKLSKVTPYLISTFSCPDIQAKGRSPYVKWTSEEDTLLRKAVGHLGCTNWQQISKEVPGRSYHQCRQRWLKVLKNSISQDNYKVNPFDVQMTLSSSLSTFNSTTITTGSANHTNNFESEYTPTSSLDLIPSMNNTTSHGHHKISHPNGFTSRSFTSNNQRIDSMTPASPSTPLSKPRKDSCPLWQILHN
ncbi:hypothetical protein K7432_004277 [Basidiobolus ranarum]